MCRICRMLAAIRKAAERARKRGASTVGNVTTGAENRLTAPP